MSLQNGGDSYPADTNGDVGTDHYVQMVNTAFAVFDKSGNWLSGPTNINDLWQGENNPCADCNDGDPIVVYDSLADRWLITQFAVSAGPPYYECMAVSRTPDPTDAYYLYAFEIPDNEFPDYPKIAVWPDAYYMSASEYPSIGAYAFDRGAMLSGLPATVQKFSRTGNFMLPCDLDGSTPPPAGTPNYFYTMGREDALYLWAFNVDFDDPSNSAFIPVQTLATTPYNYGVCGFRWDCIPQKDTDQRLDVISEWPMWRFQYRNLGTHESLVGNFTVNVRDFPDHAGIRWFELRRTDGNWEICQEGTHAPDDHHRWMGSIAMDGAGNIALGYSVSSDLLYPSIRYATRMVTDAPGVLRTEIPAVDGTAPQAKFNRWGDYSAMTVDPSDDATFWYTSEYVADSGLGWQTRILAFKVQPTARTGPAEGICNRFATLTGTVQPNGADTDCYFEYGMGGFYGGRIATINVAAGNDPVPVTARIAGLRRQTDYQYRLVAENGSGTDLGPDHTFQTLAMAKDSGCITDHSDGANGCFVGTLLPAQ